MIGFALMVATALHSLTVADRYWGGRPNPCARTFVAAVVDGGYPLAGQWTTPDGNCVVWVNASAGPFTPREVCRLIVHEVGHLRGAQHSTSPKSIMFPNPVRTPAGCKR